MITKFTATVDLGRAGCPLDALIDLSPQTTVDLEKFERQVGELDAVRELAFVTGAFDYQLRVACRDRDELHDTVRAIRKKAGGVHTVTRLVMRATPYSRPV